MKNTAFIYAQKVSGQERKVIASVIAEAIGVQATYAGVPSFAYEAGGWQIQKNGLLRSPETETAEIETLRPVLEALKNAGITAESDASIIISAEGHTGGTIRNLCNLIESKDKLLGKALGRATAATQAELVQVLTETPSDSIEDFMRLYNSGVLWLDLMHNEIGLSIFNATLNFDEVSAYMNLAQKLNDMALNQKHISAKYKQTENEAYTMRCFLLRLSFIGDLYKASRKILLSKLEGNKAFRGGVANESH